MKQHRRSALTLLAFILFTASFHTSSQAAPKDHDGIWNAVIDCEPVQWGQNNASRSVWRLPGVEIREGSTQQVMQLKGARDIIYNFNISIDMAAANPSARFDQRVASDVPQPPGSPTNQSWRYLFDAKEQNPTQKKFSGRQLHVQSNRERPCSLTLSLVRPDPASIAGRGQNR